MNLALMDYPDKRIKPPNFHTLCNYSYYREPELPSSPFFFSPCTEDFQGMEGTKPLQRKMTRLFITLIIPWDIFVFQ
jgi:hypothetical protein